ncbi:hypothetical protein ASG80_14520 [Agromyces sp. Soil535]|nr:hypothetical protein ASG80_14520 [Agromyces sp. Soil535]
MGEERRQRVERAGGKSRRARLTPAPGSDPSPEQPAAAEPQDGAKPKRGRPSPDDDRITRERPPHW